MITKKTATPGQDPKDAEIEKEARRCYPNESNLVVSCFSDSVLTICAAYKKVIKPHSRNHNPFHDIYFYAYNRAPAGVTVHDLKLHLDIDGERDGFWEAAFGTGDDVAVRVIPGVIGPGSFSPTKKIRFKVMFTGPKHLDANFDFGEVVNIAPEYRVEYEQTQTHAWQVAVDVKPEGV